MASTGTATVVTEHRLIEVEHSVLNAPEFGWSSSVQGPPVFARCACGWTARADEVNLYEAVGEHMRVNL